MLLLAPPRIPETISSVKDVNVTVGQNYSFRCDVEGDPTPDLTWLINGRPIEGILECLYPQIRHDRDKYCR